MDHQPFNAGAALVFLDEMAAQFGPSRLLSIEAAWDAAWIVCVMPDPRHEAVAEAALADVVAELKRLPGGRAPSHAISSTMRVSP